MMGREIRVEGVGMVQIITDETGSETERQERQRQYQRVAARLYRQVLDRQRESE